MKKPHKYFINGAINEDQLSAFIACDLEAGPGELLINSTGGDLVAGFALYDYIRVYSPAWTATVIGSCLSAALLPFLACKSRALTPNATLMMHEGSTRMATHNSELTALYTDAAETNRRYEAICEARSKAGSKVIRSLIAKGTYLRAEQAIALGLAHRLLPFRK